jgi:hypothetical protein
MNKDESAQDLALSDWKANNPQSPAKGSTSVASPDSTASHKKTYDFKTIISGLIGAASVGLISLLPFMFLYGIVEGSFGIDTPNPTSQTQHIIGGIIGVIGYAVAALVAYRHFRKYLSEK